MNKLYKPSGVDVSYSTRHVEESWHHLIKSEDTSKFKQIAVCNFDFLLASVSNQHSTLFHYFYRGIRLYFSQLFCSIIISLELKRKYFTIINNLSNPHTSHKYVAISYIYSHTVNSYLLLCNLFYSILILLRLFSCHCVSRS